MGMLMIKCPNTGRAISTGIQVEQAAFGAMPVFFSRTFCPACRTEHRWFAKRAWINAPEATPHAGSRLGSIASYAEEGPEFGEGL